MRIGLRVNWRRRSRAGGVDDLDWFEVDGTDWFQAQPAYRGAGSDEGRHKRVRWLGNYRQSPVTGI